MERRTWYINCGDIIMGDEPIELKGEEIFQKILKGRVGERSKSEMLGLGDNELLLDRGVMMYTSAALSMAMFGMKRFVECEASFSF